MNRPSKVVWDVPVRLFHWSLAILVVLNLFVVEEGEDIHQWIGYSACILVFFRFVWGLRSKPPTSGRVFPVSFHELRWFIQNRFLDSQGRYSGHNPLASLVYISIWICILCLGISGFTMGLDAFWGEEWLESVHESFSYALQILILIHLTGVFSDSIRNRRRTWASMITGRAGITLPLSRQRSKIFDPLFRRT